MRYISKRRQELSDVAHAVPDKEGPIPFEQIPAAGRPSSAYLATATDRTLELALQPDGGTRTTDLQRAMRALCDEARRQGMRAEELIVLFKRTWQARPELHNMSHEETGRLFDSVVTMCVEEYYDAR